MILLILAIIQLSLPSITGSVSPVSLPRPTIVRFSGASSSNSQHFGYLEIGLSDGKLGPVCNLGKFDLQATRLACLLMGFNTSLSVALLSASESQPPDKDPVIAIRDCNVFNVNIPSTWNLAIACNYVTGRDIPEQCRRSENYVQISCHSSRDRELVLLPTMPTNNGGGKEEGGGGKGGGSGSGSGLHCVPQSNYKSDQLVELRNKRPLLAGRALCYEKFGIAEATAFCYALCYGSLIGLPIRLPSQVTKASAGSVILDCTGAKRLDNCSTTLLPSSASCSSGLAGLDCLPLGDSVNKRPNASVQCSDRAFKVSFSKQMDGVTTESRLALETAAGTRMHPLNCSGATTGSNATHVWLELPYTECNVSQSYNSSHQLYRMELRLEPAAFTASLSAPAVYTDTPLTYPILCGLPSRDRVAADAAVRVASQAVAESSGAAKFLTDLALFARLAPTSDGRGLEFQQSLINDESTVQLGQPVFARVRLLNVDDSLDVRLRLLDCWATDRPASGSTPRHDLLVNRCPTAGVRLIEVSNRIVGLQFLAFRFGTKDATGRLYVHCNRSVCNQSDSDCRGCDRDLASVLVARRRRSLQTVEDPSSVAVSSSSNVFVLSNAAVATAGSFNFYPFSCSLSVLIMLLIIRPSQ